MYKSKRFFNDYDAVEDGKNAKTLIEEIVNDPEFNELEEIVIGCWGEAWDEEDAQPMVDYIADNAQKFSHIKSLFVGDMDYEDCEVSWIMQADYTRLWDAMPQLEKFTVKGSMELTLGLKSHENLKSLEIICGGLPTDVIEEVGNAKLPNLETLILYIGVDNYGFDGDINTIKTFLEKSDFPKLKYLGIVDSEIQDEVTEVVLNCKYMDQINTLDLSKGTLTDKGGELLIDGMKSHPNITKLDLYFHFLSDDMMEKMKNMADERGNLEVILDEKQENEYNGRNYYYAMLTE